MDILVQQCVLLWVRVVSSSSILFFSADSQSQHTSLSRRALSAVQRHPRPFTRKRGVDLQEVRKIRDDREKSKDKTYPPTVWYPWDQWKRTGQESKVKIISTIISTFLHYVIKTSVLEPAAPGSAGRSARAFTWGKSRKKYWYQYILK